MAKHLMGSAASLFDSSAMQRGRQYFSTGRVEIMERDAARLTAEVRGSSLYTVTLEHTVKGMGLTCTCAHFSGGNYCKHLWATLLAAEREGFLGPPVAGNSKPSTPLTSTRYESRDDSDDDVTVAPSPYAHTPWESFERPRAPNWKEALQTIQTMTPGLPPPANRFSGKRINYIIELDAVLSSQRLSLNLMASRQKKCGEWATPKSQGIRADEISQLDDPADRRILAMLRGADAGGYGMAHHAMAHFQLPAALSTVLFPEMCATGRLFVMRRRERFGPLRFDGDGPFQPGLQISQNGKSTEYSLTMFLQRGEERHALDEPLMVFAGGWIFWRDRISALDDAGAFPWIQLWREHKALVVPAKQKRDLQEKLLAVPTLPHVEWPADLRVEEVRLTPKPQVILKRPTTRGWETKDLLIARVNFLYGEHAIRSTDTRRGLLLDQPPRFVVRDAVAEAEALRYLHELGFRRYDDFYSSRDQASLSIEARLLTRVAGPLLTRGWSLEAEGKLYRVAGASQLSITSGPDWFELHGNVDFAGTSVALPALLAAMQRGETTVALGDGSFGMLPEDWLTKYARLASMGKADGDHLRFNVSQTSVLDALLEAQPEISSDAAFDQARRQLQSFEHIDPMPAPPGFQGVLRPYQAEGLGWLHFLQKFGFGGCLADDMGLGKTVQVLALLESRRAMREEKPVGDPARPAPSLVVVPRSLIFNWRKEAERFSPKLRVLEHSGITRIRGIEHLDDFDLVLTTYGTLRRDAATFKDFEFDYVILDEAQAIKNSETASAKAARLLRGRHRLAMSGTPIENHLGELWSLFAFLSPGLLGSAGRFDQALEEPDAENRHWLARVIKPFMLRRTKSQVASDLPEKHEETIFCDLGPEERKLYQELRDHYRAALLPRLDAEGMNKVRMNVLEALLRLRQAACHPGLLDKTRAHAGSAKLEVLLTQLQEVVAEGHKALVFSQFTSMLALVRHQLDAQGVTYEYLDGKTRDREERVQRFQNDPKCPLFLISLKAGGLGLNLTAAEYVFLLDPWWNPAVEAQAVDRTHRIGQTRRVFAYRLIARDTVEEKILALQASKRDLAESIITADQSIIRNLTRADLELLLG